MSGPLRYAHGNVLFGHDWRPGALYRIDTVSNRYLPERENADLATVLAEFAYTIEADGSLYRVNRYLEGHEDLAAHFPEVYILVHLVPPVGGPAASYRDQLAKVIRERLPARRGPLAKRMLDELHAKAAELEARYHASLGMRAATTRELQWLFRRCPVRGVREPDLDQHWHPPALAATGTDGDVAYEVLADALAELTDDAILEDQRTLVIDGDEARSYQAVLTVGRLPETMRFPGDAEILSRPLEALEFPVDAVLHWKWLGNEAAVTQVRDKVHIADTVLEEQGKADRPMASTRAEKNRVRAAALLDQLESSTSPPLLVTTTSLAVGAESREDLERRVTALRRAYGRVRLHRPVGLQPQLYRDHYPRTDGGRVHRHRDRTWVLNPDGESQFGAMMPTGTHHAGDPDGPYIGHTVAGVRRPVRHDITRASRTHRPPTILFVGTSGSGKTTGAQLLADLAFRRGSSIALGDPKGDMYLTDMPHIRPVATTVQLSGDREYRGLLDPLVVAPEHMREDLAASYLLALLPAAPAWTNTYIREAIKRVLQANEHPGCLHVVDALAAGESDEERTIGRALGVFADSGVAQLAFGDGRQRGGDEARAVRYDLSALELPAPGARAYDEGERLGVATLKLALMRAVTVAKRDLSRHDVIVLDEAHVLLDTPDGLKFVDKITRTARSLNITLILASQHVTDAGTLEDLVGYRFVCGQETVRAAREAIRMLGLDEDDRGLQRLVMRMREGRCLYRDLDGDIADMQLDLDPELLTVLNTDPNASRQRVPVLA